MLFEKVLNRLLTLNLYTPNEDDKKKVKIIKGMAALSIKEILGSLLGVFYFIIATRELGVEGITVVSILSMLYTFFPLFLYIHLRQLWQCKDLLRD